MCTTQGPSGIVANLAANEAPDPPRGVRAEPETWGDRPGGTFESVVANPVKNGDAAVEGPRLKKYGPRAFCSQKSSVNTQTAKNKIFAILEGKKCRWS